MDNVNVRLEQIDLYASNCFGFLEYNCDGSTYDRCRIDRRSPESDLADRGDPRLRSLDADAFHSKHAVKGPAYVECTARFMGDDCINICGDYHMIMASCGKQLRVLAKHAMNIQPGDPVELVIAICVQALAGNGAVASAGAHQNIAIVGNTVKRCPQPGILVTSTRRLQLKDNRLELNAANKDLPGILRGAGVKELEPIIEINCQR